MAYFWQRMMAWILLSGPYTMRKERAIMLFASVVSLLFSFPSFQSPESLLNPKINSESFKA